MPSRVRMLLKVYPQGLVGHNAYYGSNVIHFLEKATGHKLVRPYKLTDLHAFYLHAREVEAALSVAIQLDVWQVRRGLKKCTYIKDLEAARKIFVWHKEREAFVAKKADEKKPFVYFDRAVIGRAQVPFQAVPRFRLRRPGDLEEDFLPEPIDR